jgi:branched-chain amino acid transport system substrate-binding protein
MKASPPARTNRTDFTAAIAKLREANCDPDHNGDIVRDSTLIIATVKKVGWNVDLLGQVASYDTAIADAPGNVAEGFYSMSPSLYAYPDDPRPEIKAFTQKYKTKYGVDVNYLGEMGYTSAQIAIEALQHAGHELTVDSLVKAM